jgi:hypothetical protein
LKVATKAGDRALEYSDRIAAKALNEAAWNDNELIADYLGGVLAASSRDNDDGAAVIAQIARLSAYHLRLHYIIYRELRRLTKQPTPNLYTSNEADAAGIRIPVVVDLLPALAPADVSGLAGAIAVLYREGLVADAWTVGKEVADPPDHPLAFTMVVRPTGVGAELFLWAHGVRPPHARRKFEAEIPLTMLTDVPETPCATLQSQPVLAVLEPEPRESHDESVRLDDPGASPPEPITVG